MKSVRERRKREPLTSSGFKPSRVFLVIALSFSFWKTEKMGERNKEFTAFRRHNFSAKVENEGAKRRRRRRKEEVQRELRLEIVW